MKSYHRIHDIRHNVMRHEYFLTYHDIVIPVYDTMQNDYIITYIIVSIYDIIHDMMYGIMYITMLSET